MLHDARCAGSAVVDRDIYSKSIDNIILKNACF